MELPIEALGPQGPLAGTMLRGSDAQGPVALIMHGSGPTDRDGNSPLGVRAASYRLLAQGLAAEGITTVRIDTRPTVRRALGGAPRHSILRMLRLHPLLYRHLQKQNWQTVRDAGHAMIATSSFYRSSTNARAWRREAVTGPGTLCCLVRVRPHAVWTRF